MKRNLHKFESTFWLFVKAVLYISLMILFIVVMSRESIGLTRLSRTMGITVTTFAVVGALFLFVFGKYDVGRKKSKPIIYSLVLAVLCTDIVTYLQLMIMRTNTGSVRQFRLTDIGDLVLVIVLQIILIILFVYAGNAVFFRFHQPESCCVITSSQKCLDEIARAILKFKKQYRIDLVLDYRDEDWEKKMKGIDTAFIYDVPAQRRMEILRFCYHDKINVYFNPEIEDIMEQNAQQYVIEDVYLFNKNVKALTMEQRVAKRLIDIFLSLFLLVLTSPLTIAGMIAIKLDDGGPVLFRQERATINGRRFQVIKLRTMRQNAEIRSADKDDDRITRPGKILRRTRIDELPQLVNVLKGDMSFVGPRPEMIKNVEEYEEELPEFHYRLRVKAGLTGYAQINGKYNTSPKDKLVMDMMYIEQFSIFHDIQLIFQTAIAVLKSDSSEGFYKKQPSYYVFPSVDREKETKRSKNRRKKK